ncbi:Transcriptional regulatory protein ZraR [Roseovarius litorisediminis]|uniref:Transcriptional regulatory protein ZraR n=1 Tax=Roseovarius litorisediminis TaxID=1312363 RepID=A0A1Y5SP76_9RHOB|nr:response regulator [Roseovarius litorisediminis]SLN45059.1 Transcriptional regulatory protein ZraR [Roseovarius litorisediminis]
MTARILMVDDEADACELFRQNFRREIRKGLYSFDFARSGEDALEVLRTGEPPKVLMVLSDINMPGMSGLELLEHIRRERPEIDVVMITAYGDPETARRATCLGASNLMTKPVDFAQLKRRLANSIEQPG